MWVKSTWGSAFCEYSRATIDWVIWLRQSRAWDILSFALLKWKTKNNRNCHISIWLDFYRDGSTKFQHSTARIALLALVFNKLAEVCHCSATAPILSLIWRDTSNWSSSCCSVLEVYVPPDAVAIDGYGNILFQVTWIFLMYTNLIAHPALHILCVTNCNFLSVHWILISHVLWYHAINALQCYPDTFC